MSAKRVFEFWFRACLGGTSRRRAFCAGLLVTLAAQPTEATWSIVVADLETQEVIVASATCVTDLDLKVYLPVIAVGKGGGSAQGYVDSTGQRRLIIWDGLLIGLTAHEIIDQLAVLPGSHNHQHGIAEATYGTAASISGASSWPYASGVTGSFGAVHYAIQGGALAGSPVIALAEDALVNTPGDLPAKVIAAMEAARSMGGDGRCSCNPNDPTGCGSPPPNFDKAAHQGFMVVSRFGDTDDFACNSAGCADGDYFMDFNIAFQVVSDPDPVFQLQALFDAARQDLIWRPDAIASTVSFTDVGDPGGDWLLRVELNDWRGTLLGQSVLNFSAEHALDSDQVTTIGSIVDVGDGSYEVSLTETGQPGVDVFQITADDGIRPVVLPPRRATLVFFNVFSDGFESGNTSAWSFTVP